MEPPVPKGAAGISDDDPDKAARLARLARKAESARLARLRHKKFVQDKQSEVTNLQAEEEALLEEEATVGAAALQNARSELRKALSPEQLQVRCWPKDCGARQHHPSALP